MKIVQIVVAMSCIMFGAFGVAEAQEQTIFKEDFESNHHGWQEWESLTSKNEIEDGKYILEHKEEDGGFITWFPGLRLDQNKNFEIQIVVDIIKEDNIVIYWGKDYKNYYAWGIDTDGWWYYGKRIEGKWDVIIDWKKSNYIKKLTNTLKLRNVEKRVEFFINGKKSKWTKEFEQVFGDNVGVGIYGKSKIAIDNITITYVPQANDLEANDSVSFSQAQKSHGWLGVMISPVTEEIAKEAELKENSGVFVQGVMKNSPANKAGITPGTVIVSFNGISVNEPKELTNLIMQTEIGKKIPIVLLQDGEQHNREVTIGRKLGMGDPQDDSDLSQTPIPIETPIQSSLQVSKQDALPLMTITSEIPRETEREILVIEGVATDDKGIRDIEIRVQSPGKKGLSITSGVPKEGNRFKETAPLEIGQNTIIIEAIDTIGQRKRETFSVVRKALMQPSVPPIQLTPEDYSLINRPGDVYAVIIGIGDYQDEKIPDLRFTVNDAKGLYDVLTNPDYGGVPKKNIQLLLDKEATIQSIKTAIGKWLRRQAKENDTVIIYYSGHGAPEEEETYWVTYGAKIDNLYATALDNNEIANMLSRIRSKRVITFLDSCYSAATIQRKDQTRSVQTKIPWEKFSGEGRVAISASDGTQLSLELDTFQHGVFTYYLLEGLKGKADHNADGVIEVDEIWNYVKRQVSEAAQKAGNPQTPVFQGTVTAGIPLTFNVETLQAKQQDHVKQQKRKTLQALYEQGQITPKHFECALDILEAGNSNRYLEDLLSDKLTPETFRQFFECDSVK